MPDMKELFETVSRQAPAVPDALDRQLRRQRRVARRRKVGAIGLAAVFVAVVVVAAIASRHPTSDGSIAPSPAAAGWVDAGSIADLSKEGVVYLAEAEVFVVARPERESPMPSRPCLPIPRTGWRSYFGTAGRSVGSGSSSTEPSSTITAST